MTKNKNNYIPFYYDALFYKIFGDEKDVSLLKIIIELSLDIKINELTILNDKILGDKHPRNSFKNIDINNKDSEIILFPFNIKNKMKMKYKYSGYVLKKNRNKKEKEKVYENSSSFS